MTSIFWVSHTISFLGIDRQVADRNLVPRIENTDGHLDISATLRDRQVANKVTPEDDRIKDLALIGIVDGDVVPVAVVPREVSEVRCRVSVGIGFFHLQV